MPSREPTLHRARPWPQSNLSGEVARKNLVLALALVGVVVLIVLGTIAVSFIYLHDQCSSGLKESRSGADLVLLDDAIIPFAAARCPGRPGGVARSRRAAGRGHRPNPDLLFDALE